MIHLTRTRRFSLSSCAFLCLLTSRGTSAATPQEIIALCPELATWLKVYDETLPEHMIGKSLDEEIEAPKREYAARLQGAQSLFESFLNGTRSGAQISACLEKIPIAGNFLYTFQSAALDISVAQLRVKAPPATQALLAERDRVVAAGTKPLFRITLHLDPSPTSERGGFHRGTRSVFMDLDRISAPDWLPISAHELKHYVDPTIFKASQEYADEATDIRIQGLARSKKSIKQLKPDELALVQNWLKAGLSRGLWAEYRAWYTTFEIYIEQVRAGNWRRSAWLENKLKKRKPGEPLAKFVYRLLDENFDSPPAVPPEGISDPESEAYYKVFASPMIQAVLKDLRDGYRQERYPLPPLGDVQGANTNAPGSGH